MANLPTRKRRSKAPKKDYSWFEGKVDEKLLEDYLSLSQLSRRPGHEARTRLVELSEKRCSDGGWMGYPGVEDRLTTTREMCFILHEQILLLFRAIEALERKARLASKETGR